MRGIPSNRQLLLSPPRLSKMLLRPSDYWQAYTLFPIGILTSAFRRLFSLCSHLHPPTTKWVSYATKPNMNSATAKLIQLTNYTKPNSAESQAYGVDTSHQLESLSIDDCRYIRIVKIVLKMLQNICVVIKTTTSCVCLRAKGGAKCRLQLLPLVFVDEGLAGRRSL